MNRKIQRFLKLVMANTISMVRKIAAKPSGIRVYKIQTLQQSLFHQWQRQPMNRMLLSTIAQWSCAASRNTLSDHFSIKLNVNIHVHWMGRPLSKLLTRWVPYDGYIRHQNDHLSGRMTDISVMGEWQVAGVGGIRPLEKVLGEALEGRFSFEARNYLFFFQR